jgi:hypothetical protein
MLTVRFGQLTAWGLSPHKIRSLVGCSPNAKLRAEIIPSAPVNANNTAVDHRNAPHSSAPTRSSLSPAAQTGVRYRY